MALSYPSPESFIPLRSPYYPIYKRNYDIPDIQSRIDSAPSMGMIQESAFGILTIALEKKLVGMTPELSTIYTAKIDRNPTDTLESMMMFFGSMIQDGPASVSHTQELIFSGISLESTTLEDENQTTLTTVIAKMQGVDQTKGRTVMLESRVPIVHVEYSNLMDAESTVLSNPQPDIDSSQILFQTLVQKLTPPKKES